MSEKKQAIATLGDRKYLTQVITENHTFLVDEPEKNGGGNKAPHPRAYLLGALSACTAVTMRMYAERKGWETGQIRVSSQLREKIDQKGQIGFQVDKEVVFEKELPAEQVERLLQVGEKCPVSQLLKAEVRMTSKATEQLQEGIVKEYHNDEFAVVWKPNLCQHSKRCWKELLPVFNPQKKPWIDMSGATTEQIIQQVERCPSGALSYYRLEKGEKE